MHWYRPPNDSGVNMGPDPLRVNPRLKNDKKQTVNPMNKLHVGNYTERMNTEKITTNKKSLSTPTNINNMRFIDPMLLNQLQTNPYNIPYYEMCES